MSSFAPDLHRVAFARDVRVALSKPQKELPPRYFYDDVGSALFEAITRMPEYGLTKAEERILQSHAEGIAAQLTAPLVVAELGSGSGSKTRWILEAVARHQPVVYYPIDVSSAALAECGRQLSAIESVRVVELERTYIDGLQEVTRRRASGERLLVLFLGSTIGNFYRAAASTFLCEIRSRLCPGDALLLGTDLVKPIATLLEAYDDPPGVTAAFNLNLLARINRELDADFDVRGFAHEVRYNVGENRIEMHLRSLARQTVRIPAAGMECHFQEGETIWTESSHKFSLDDIRALAEQARFTCAAQWVDQAWPFAESLLMA